MAELNSTIVKGSLNTTGNIYENGTRVITFAITGASSSGNTLTLTPSSGSNITFTPTFTDTNYYPSRSFSSGLQISTSQGVTNTCALYVPNVSASTSGVVPSLPSSASASGDGYVLFTNGSSGETSWTNANFTKYNVDDSEGYAQNIRILTQTQYNNLSTKNSNTVYIIID